MEKTNQKGTVRTLAGNTRKLAGTAVTVLALAVSFAGGAARCQAAGNTYDTAVDAGFGETFSSLFHDRAAGSPLEAEPADGVDTASGHLILTRTDLSLEGTGGMDFELNRCYDSNEAVVRQIRCTSSMQIRCA